MRAKSLFVLLVVLAFGMLSFGIVSAQDDVPRGGTVMVSATPRANWTRNFNPFAPDPADGTDTIVYEPLIIFNPVEGGAPTYWLATDYAYSEDLMSLTYNLREGVQWSDGEEFNADDVVFTVEMFQARPELDRLAMLEFTEGIEKVDDYTVTFNLNRVYTQADTVIGGLQPLPEHIWSELEDPVTFANEEPVATGPFTEVRNFSEQYYELCRNENYWMEGRPYVDCLGYPAYTSNDSANLALINGELDWVGNFVPDIEETFVSVDPEHNHYYFWPGGGTVQLYMLTTKEPFSDLQFRRALSMAIDYNAVVNIGMYGYTIPANPTGLGPAHDVWVSDEALSVAEEMGLGQYDPEGAAAILDEAGYVDADGDGWRDMPNGDSIQFSVQVVTGWTDWVTSVDIMSQNFQEIGLNAELNSLDFGVWLDNLQQGNYDASIGWSTSGRTPWNFYRNQLDSSLIDAEGFANAELWARWTSEETDELLSAFTATADPDEQAEILNQIQLAFVENVVAVPLFPGPTWYEWVTTRFTGFPTREDYYAQGSPWHVGSAFIVSTSIHCVDDTSCGQSE